MTRWKSFICNNYAFFNILTYNKVAICLSIYYISCKNLSTNWFHCVYIIGINKIAPTLGAALDRASNIAAPLNAKRLNKKTPCAVTGKCSHCNSPDCICNVTAITHHPTKYQTEVHVVIAGENLGY